MERKYLVLRGVVWTVCIYHVLLGVALNAPVGLITWVATNVLGATRMPDASALFLARMLGTYLIVFGVAMGVVAFNPIKNRALLTLSAILVVLRAIQRVVQSGDLDQALGISAASNYTTIAILILIAAALAFFRFQIYREMHDS